MKSSKTQIHAKYHKIPRINFCEERKLTSYSGLVVFLRVVRGWYRERGREAGIRECEGGSVTFAQRFGSALNSNPHFHALLLDGIFNARTNVFHPAPQLQDKDVKEIVELTAKRVIALLQRRGILDDEAYDDFACDQPLLAGMTEASVLGLVSTGDRAGMRVRRVLSDPSEAVQTGDLCLTRDHRFALTRRPGSTFATSWTFVHCVLQSYSNGFASSGFSRFRKRSSRRSMRRRTSSFV